MPPKDRAGEKAAVAAGAGSSGEIPLPSVPNPTIPSSQRLQRSPGTTATTTGPLRVAGETKQCTGTTSNTPSCPRGSSPRTVRSNSRVSRAHTSPCLDADHGNATAKGFGGSSTTLHRTAIMEKAGTAGLSVGDQAPQRQRATVKAGRGTSMETPQKHRSVTRFSGDTKQKHHAATTCSNGEETMKHEHTTGSGGGPSGETMPKKSYRKKKKTTTVPKKTRFPEEIMKWLQEADRVIQELNERGLGEDISTEELDRYADLLPDDPPRVDTSLKLEHEQLHKRHVSQVLYRVKYYKWALQGRRGEDSEPWGDDADELQDDDPLAKLRCFDDDGMDGEQILDYLHEEGLLGHIQSDSTFDWVFQFPLAAGLDDYQRIVLHNFGGCAFADWDRYRKYFHKYETALEYLDFWEELSKKLKWMEEYVSVVWDPLTWDKILDRGSSQAIKVAAGFSKIPASLAREAYLECVDSMLMDFYLCKELDGVYFEVWKRVAKLKMSFRAALDEVYKLDKFPMRQHRMRVELESDGSEMENEFDICTADITEDAAEDKVQELIADAITKLEGRPKFYAQYIRRKIEIARAIGVIPAASP